MALAVNEALEAVYHSINHQNERLDAVIAVLKEALAAAGQKSVEVDKSRLAQNNRQGRKMMQTYFKKRGVIVTFADDAAG